MKELLRRLHYLLHRRRHDRELLDEMAFHREMAERHGTGPVGNTLRLREEAHDAWGWTWIDRLMQDLRYAVRTMQRSPAFSAAAVLMLAIGIGVNVAAFGFVNAAFLRRLPIRDPETLLRFERRSPDRYATEVPYPTVAYLRDATQTLSAVLAMTPRTLALDGTATRVTAHFVTTNFFSELGAPLHLGRGLSPTDDRPDAPTAIVISDAFWRRQFTSDPAIVGREVVLNHHPAVVIGVASPTFGGLTFDDPDVWLPLTRHPALIAGSLLLTGSGDDDGVRMWGRMRADVGAPQVEAELASLLETRRAQQPEGIWEHERLASEPGGRPGRGGGSSHGTGPAPRPKVAAMLTLSGALTLAILAVACGNLGSLLLARGVSRAREMSIRVAVGAAAPRLIRQLLTESLVLATCGALVGLGLGQLLLGILVSVSGAPSWLDTRPDWRVGTFMVGVTALATVLFGFAPAIQIARQRRHSTLIRHVLIGAQIAASCVLLIIAGLLVRALERMTSTDPGFAYQQVIAVNPDLVAHGYTAARAERYLTTLRDRLQSVPGVATVSFASTPPLGRRKTVLAAEIDGRRVDVHINHIDATFLSTMRIPLVRGRTFRSGDTQTMVVSDSLARTVWPGEDPIGRTFDGRTVIGVAGSARQTALQDPDAVEGYFPMGPAVWPSVAVLVQTTGAPEDALRAVASVAADIDADVFPEVEMLKTAFARKHDTAAATAMGVSLLGTSALVLACIGIVGLVAYSVAQQTKEIGIRLALGASGTHVLSSVLRQLSRPVAVGLLLGTAGAAALSQLLRRELYGVSHLDPAAYIAALAIFALTVAVAAWWPARRALAVDPLHALRTD